ncbi:hypothetical protein K458DRAFT_113092 [Lentithecium fluviatile CBS 122367]|uniref:Uncharacterized protein n=1 Tax=Lentithecium fluviatile CBS 122367 TaxID=1168545 RepID=A0A6G1IPT0_9PLEO|nr:hypothetical protein K458DRAFT_113092 [Lentithecium fluviatile CBS 122367]
MQHDVQACLIRFPARKANPIPLASPHLSLLRTFHTPSRRLHTSPSPCVHSTGIYSRPRFRTCTTWTPNHLPHSFPGSRCKSLQADQHATSRPTSVNRLGASTSRASCVLASTFWHVCDRPFPIRPSAAADRVQFGFRGLNSQWVCAGCLCLERRTAT